MPQKKPDIIKSLTYRPLERMAVLRALSLPERSAVFVKLSPYVQQSILKQLKTHEIVDMLDHLDMQQTKKILTHISSVKIREKILARLKGDVREKIEYFLRFHPKATLALINFNYLFLDGETTIGETADIIEEHYHETSRFPEVLVHDRGELLGEVPIASMVKERNSAPLRRFVQTVKTVSYQSDINTVIETLVSTDCKKVIILDHDTSVLGIIYIDEARALFGHLPAESLYDFAGVDKSEKPFDSVLSKVASRYRWLILNLATSFLAGSVVLTFQKTIDIVTVMSVYIPIVAGMGGNAANQSFAIMVRGLTLGTISLQNAGPAIRRELLAGVINGVIIGSIVAVLSIFWGGGFVVGLVVAAALIGAHTVAGLAGSFVPLLMKHLGKDPASTSTIFITTATDVMGLFFLLGLATLILL